MPFSSVMFDAVFEGQGNVNAGRTGGVDGMKRFLHKFGSEDADGPIMVEYQAQVDELGMWYMEQVKEQFAAKHGRTGETASTMHSEFDVVPGEMTYRTQMDGGVGFVLNPLPTHVIPGTAFLNDQSQTTGRQTNFFSPFDYLTRAGGVGWYQGGDESFSPDDSWYKDEIPELAALARTSFRTMASKVSVLWNEGGAA